jgi:hypothetical protein
MNETSDSFMPLTESDWELLDLLARISFFKPSNVVAAAVVNNRIVNSGYGKVNFKGELVITARGRRALQDRAGSA